MKKIIVAYLSSGFVEIKSLKKFLQNYKKFSPGYHHEIIICFKKLDDFEKKKRIKLIEKLNINFFDDVENVNDHEWGTLKRLCQLNKNRLIFWMNDHSYPQSKNWLRKIMKHYQSKTFLGTSGSFSSHYSNSFFRNKNDNYFKAIFKIIFFYLNVPKFPNAHVRATGFLIHANDFITFMKNKIVRTKLQSFLIESGYNGLSNFFIRKKYKIFIINKNGKKFNLKNMRDSLTFAYGKQNKYLISDNHIRNYLRLSIKDKLKRAKQTWGK